MLVLPCELCDPQKDAKPLWGSVSSSVKWAKNTPQGEVKIPDTVPGRQHGVGSTNGPEEKLGGPSPTAVPVWLCNFTHTSSLYHQRTGDTRPQCTQQDSTWGVPGPLRVGQKVTPDYEAATPPVTFWSLGPAMTPCPAARMKPLSGPCP